MNIRPAAALAVLVLILQLVPLTAAASCAGYHETFTVNVLDASGRPIENASIVVKYDRGQSFGDKYFITPAKLTDSKGQIYYDIYNGGTNTRTIDCEIEINASAGGAAKTVVIEANKHGPTVDVIMEDVYTLRFFVRDQFKAALEDASVAVGNYSGTTDRYGMFTKQLRAGTYQYLASYMDAGQAGSMNITNDTEFEVLFSHYKVTLDVTDDSGNPLPVELMVFNRTFDLPDGHFENEKTFGEAVPYKVTYRGIVNESVITPVSEPIVTVRLDVSSPLFGNITPKTANDRYQLTVEAWDPNRYASGLDLGSMSVYYKIEPSDATTPWGKAIVYSAGRTSFTADFPELPDDSIIKFRAEVKDRAGNRAEKEGQFTTYAVAPPANTTQNETNPQPPEPQEQGIPLIYIIGGVFLLILAVYLVIHMKSKPA
jgi:hypothetical protein